MKVVVKLGGELLEPDRSEELGAIAGDVRSLIEASHRVVFVHGGGSQTTALMRAFGHEPRIVGGRRVTDDVALAAIEMAIGGKLNIELVSALRRTGVNAVGLSGVSGGLIRCVKRPPKVVEGHGDEPVDFGHVGDVVGINHELLELLWRGGYTPVVACIGGGEDGRVFNINADTVASGVAEGLGADSLFLFTNTPGVLRDVNDPSSRYARLTAGEAKDAMARGIIKGGMIPKLEESLALLERGIARVHILGRVRKGDLFSAMEDPGSVGTVLLGDVDRRTHA